MGFYWGRRPQYNLILYYIMKEKRFSFLLNSKNNIGGANNSQRQYYIDWAKLPQGKYKVHFTYNGGINALAGDKFGFLVIDCGAVCDVNYVNGTSDLGMCILGILRVNSIKNTASTLYADDGTNESIILETKPSSNITTVSIYSNVAGNPTLFTDDSAVAPSDYLLYIHFELIE